jgi:hypothetical protein
LVNNYDCLPVPGDTVITAEQLKIAKAREFARAAPFTVCASHRVPEERIASF